MSKRFTSLCRQFSFLTIFSTAMLGTAAHAQPSVLTVVPTDSVARADFVRIGFGQEVMQLGSDVADPFFVECEGTRIDGSGKWPDNRTWQYDFAAAITAPHNCLIRSNPDFSDLDGERLEESEYKFTTGNLNVRTRPWPGSKNITEDQHFILTFNGNVPDEQLTQYGYCAVEGIGERLPFKVLSGAESEPYFEVVGARVNTEWTKVVHCGRQLPSGAEMSLVLEADLSTEFDHRLGKTERFEYQVREPFEGEVSCKRLRQGEPCMPLSDIKIGFNALVDTDQLKQLRLNVNGEARAPDSIGNDGSYESNIANQAVFKGPFPEQAELQLVVPKGFSDDLERALANRDSLSQGFVLDEFPPLAKFAKQEFGIYELFEESDSAVAVIPVTQRRLAQDQQTGPTYLNSLSTTNDAEVMRWLKRFNRLDERTVDTVAIGDIMADSEKIQWGDESTPTLDTRAISIFAADQVDLEQIELPQLASSNGAEAEVIGVPLKQSGFHVLELKSPTLGNALLAHDGLMHVRTTALVTNLAVHIKYSAEDFLAWVTRLDTGEPVANATVNILNCQAKLLHSGTTDEQGRLYLAQALEKTESCYSSDIGDYFVSANIAADHPAAQGGAQYSFALSDWTDGIEAWRFNLSNYLYQESDNGRLVEHSFFDRPLYQRGQLVAMKHYLRVLDKHNLSLPRSSELPEQIRLTHQGSGDHYDLNVQWLLSPSGGLSATTYWSLPTGAKFGRYSLSYLSQGKEILRSEQSFRVEEFKVPFLNGSIVLGTDGQEGILVAPDMLNVDLQLNYISGGPASNWDTEVSAMIGEAALSFKDYPDYQFAATLLEDEQLVADEEPQGDKVFLRQQALALDEHGRGHLAINAMPTIKNVSRVRVENGFMDPNGELQTIQQSIELWPADLAIGMQVESFDQGDVSAEIDLVLLDATAQPLANHPVSVRALQAHYFAVRKRLVGGFYSYDSEQRTEDLGVVCDGQTDAEGKFSCEVPEPFKGRITFQAMAEDEQGRVVSNASSSYFSGWGWLGSADHDRIDIVADKKRYKSGDTAALQVRMPFQKATALVALERAGILETQVHELDAADPNIRLEVDSTWYPNVYVSVLAVRGRVEGDDSNDGAEGQARITGLIDLNKPSFRYGITELKVDDPDKQFDLQISLDQDTYQLREIATAKIKGTLHDGTPASRASVAVAVVDQALLELAEHNSTNIINSMRRERGYGVSTATAQSEVVGRRHYGRKAVAAGGAAADLAKRGGTRELFDTLLLWHPSIELDANGEATVPIYLNDSISRFRVIAVGDYGVERFAEAQTEFNSAKDLQLISGLPSLVREQDQYDLSLTLRNTTDRALNVVVGGNSRGALESSLDDQEITLDAKQSQTITWPVQITSASARNLTDAKDEIIWNFFAIEKITQQNEETALSDRIKVTQKVQPLVPITVRQSAMLQLDGKAAISTLAMGLPDTALEVDGQTVGGVSVQLQSSLLGQSDELKQWFTSYPYTCYEQLAAIAVGLDDQQAWDSLMLELPQYLDAQGLVKYFPSARAKGSANLTAHILSLSLHAKRVELNFEIPTEHKERMLRGLEAAFEGRLAGQYPHQQWRWSSRLAALTTLAEYGQVTARTATSFYEQYNQWHMNDWINWLIIAKRIENSAMEPIADEAKANLLALMSREGQLLIPQSNESTNTWWTMYGREANLAKLLFVVADDETWSADLPYLLNGLLSMQRQGHWGTTIANSYAKLAMQHYALNHESTVPTGALDIALSSASSERPTTSMQREITAESFIDEAVMKLEPLPWPSKKDNQLSLDFEGEGKLWATVSAHAAVPLLEAKYAGYQLQRDILPVVQQTEGQWTQGDVYRVQLKIQANSPMTWVVLNDPIPSGATILGSGLGRDSAILQAQSAQAAAENQPEGEGDDSNAYWRNWPAFVERGTDSYKVYYDYLAQGETVLEYTVRLNHTGEFNLPPTRIEALYNPDVYGEWPNNELFKVHTK